MDIKDLNKLLEEEQVKLNILENDDFEDDDEVDEAAFEEYELFVLEEIKPISDKLYKLKSLLNDIGADERAEALDKVLDYVL